MTPWAMLLATPGDSDEDIRKAYHAIAKGAHPDATAEKPSELWFDATAAYTAIKTRERRDDWARKQATLSGTCADCRGFGVAGTRRFKGRIRVCAACGGAGRTATTKEKGRK